MPSCDPHAKVTMVNIGALDDPGLSAMRPSRHRSVSRLFRVEEEDRRSWSETALFGAWLVPVALLVGIFALGLSTYSMGSRPLDVSLLRVQNLTAELVQEGSRAEASPPAAPAPPPGVAPRAFDPLAAFHHLELLNNASDGFFRVLWEEKTARLWLEVADDDLGSEFVVAALVSRGDGSSSLLHQPRTASERTVFKLEAAPHIEGTLDLIAPQYETHHSLAFTRYLFTQKHYCSSQASFDCPLHLHCSHDCKIIARLMRNIRLPSRPPLCLPYTI